MISKPEGPAFRTPMHTNNKDLLRVIEEKNRFVSTGMLGGLSFDNRLADANASVYPTIARTGTTYSHWFSGGEFSLPVPGIECATLNQNGEGTILSYLPAKDAKTYYRFGYSTQPVKENADSPETRDRDVNANYRGGMPSDIIFGDQGVYSMEGYSYGILSGGPAFMQSGPMSSIEFYDFNDTVRITSHNYEWWSGLGELNCYTNEAKDISGIVFKAHDQYSFSTGQANIQLETEDTEDEPDIPTSNYRFYLGSGGGLLTEVIPDKMYRNLSREGEHYNRSVSGFTFTTGGVPAYQEDPYSNLRPELNTDNDIENFEEIFPDEFQYLDEGSRMSQEIDYQFDKNLSKTLPFDQDRLQEADDIRARTRSLEDGIFHMRDDGSIIIMSKSGSTIEMSADGNIYISAAQDIIMNPRNNIVQMAGNELYSVSRNGTTIRSTDNDINLISRGILDMYSDNAIRCEAQGAPTETDGNAISFVATEGNILASGRDVKLKGESNVLLESSRSITSKSKTLEYQGTEQRTKVDRAVFDAQEYSLRLSKVMNISSERFYWSGKSFVYSASLSGLLNAPRPIIINHEHTRANGIFEYASCLLGCTVDSIITPPRGVSVPQAQGFTEAIHQDISTPEGVNFSDKQTASPNTYDFYYTPWQLYAGEIKWETLETPVKGSVLFPADQNLIFYRNSELFRVNWREYIL